MLKAFNTTFAATLASKTVGDKPTTVLIAGDDAEAKATLADAITAGGVQAVDAGGLNRAHELEALGFLQLTLAAERQDQLDRRVRPGQLSRGCAGGHNVNDPAG